MQIPPRLMPLVEYGVITSVIRPLMSGKEAQVYLVESDGNLRAAKVYKAANDRTFRNRATYTEGRQVRNSRDQRAMGKRSRHGRERDEAAWNSAEADTIYKLDAAGVRVPKPYAFVEGVLVMECIKGPDGGPAPRLAECTPEPALALSIFDQLLREVVKMLCAGVVHGDLSVFNVLLDSEGPVVIDFPQAIDAAQNRNAKEILLRDITNLTSHFKRGKPARELRFGHEMWALYERGELRPDDLMTGRIELPKHSVDTDRLIQHMREVEEDEALAFHMDGFEFDKPISQVAPPREAPPLAATPAPDGPEMSSGAQLSRRVYSAPPTKKPAPKEPRSRRRGGGEQGEKRGPQKGRGRQRSAHTGDEQAGRHTDEGSRDRSAKSASTEGVTAQRGRSTDGAHTEQDVGQKRGRRRRRSRAPGSSEATVSPERGRGRGHSPSPSDGPEATANTGRGRGRGRSQSATDGSEAANPGRGRGRGRSGSQSAADGPEAANAGRGRGRGRGGSQNAADGPETANPGRGRGRGRGGSQSAAHGPETANAGRGRGRGRGGSQTAADGPEAAANPGRGHGRGGSQSGAEAANTERGRGRSGSAPQEAGARPRRRRRRGRPEGKPEPDTGSR